MHVLHSTLAPRDGLPDALYLRLTRGGLARPLRGGAPGPLGLTLHPGEVLSTDTFFGSFYLAHWQARTAVAGVTLAARLRGRGEIRVFEDTRTPDTGPPGPPGAPAPRLLAAWPFDHPDAAPLTAPVPPATGRLFVEVAAEAGVEVHALDITAPTVPVRRATLSIGLVTFNREDAFARTLTAIADLARDTDAIAAVHVVNQGAPFADPALRALLARPKIHAVAQRNLGGCGGFTRTLMAALAADPPATHHLMMDDDIVLDARLILRALRFLDHARGDIALGAGMIDALTPTVMYEAGAFLRPDNTIAPHGQGVDMAVPGALVPFNAPVATDYNAWWFCALPLAGCRAVGLPVPVFLRGDDFEYGQRLAGAGVPTVTLPGIAVWHEPFHAKPEGWQSYYDLRNRLIFAATHPDRVRQLGLAHVAGLVTTAALTHAHAIAALRLRAVEDFLAGPEALFARDPAALQAEILALNRREACERLDDSAWASVPPAPVPPRSPRMAGLVLQQAWSLLRTGLGPHRRTPEPVLLDGDVHAASTAGRGYVLTNAPRSYHLRRVPRRARLWGLMARTAAVMWRYRRQRAAANAAWAAGIAPYRTPAWWAGLFAASGEGPDGAPGAGSGAGPGARPGGEQRP